MENIKKLIYVNGGLDFSPIDKFDSATEYIYVDTLPRAEYDTYKLKSRLYRGQFIQQALIKLVKRGYVLSSIIVLNPEYTWTISSLRQKIRHGFGKLFRIPSFEMPQMNPTKYTFVNRSLNKTLKYYMNTNMKYNMTPELHNDIMYSDAVVVSELTPKKEFVEHFYKPKIFITREEGIQYMHNNDCLLSTIKNESIDRYFSQYLLFDGEWEYYKSYYSCSDI